MNKLLCTLYSMYDVHCTAYNVRCTLCNVQCPMYSFHYTSRYANEYMCPYTMPWNNNCSSMSPFETQTISQHCYWITRIIYCADNTSYIYIYLANCNNMLLIQLTVIVWWPWTHLCPYIIRYNVRGTVRTKLSVTLAYVNIYYSIQCTTYSVRFTYVYSVRLRMYTVYVYVRTYTVYVLLNYHL